MATKHTRRAFVLEEYHPMYREWKRITIESNREKMLKFIQTQYRELRYYVEGTKLEKLKPLGSYATFCRRWSESTALYLSGESTVRNDRVKLRLMIETYFNK